MPKDLTDASTHFSFGENWASYSTLIDERRINEAVADLARLVGDLQGKSFLDIGCGSGLHALAAARLGASRILAVDIDSNSVETTQHVLADRVPVPHRVMQASVFSLPDLDLGTFDVVYSWGVLHHTGAMYDAVRKSAQMVSPGGIFAFALYKKTPFSRAWMVEKRLYSRSPKPVQAIIRGLYFAAFATRYQLTGRSVREFMRGGRERGMEFWHDVHDWLGGYPYESILPEEVEALMQELGFEFVRSNIQPASRGVLGSTCDEYVYARPTAQ